MDGKDRPPERGDELSDRELSILEHQGRQKELCGKYVCALERRLPGAGMHLQRMAVPMVCGTRSCAPCFFRSRGHAEKRMQGDWQQFQTLTVGRDSCSRLHAWRQAGQWASTLMKWLGKEAEKAGRRCPCKGGRNRAPHPVVDLKGRKFEYAWVIEPTESEWPHWHMVWSAQYVCYDWLREQWQAVTGCGYPNIDGKPKGDSQNFARYMVSYMFKGKFSDEVLAIMYRKRLWASTRELPLKWENGWTVVDFAHVESFTKPEGLASRKEWRKSIWSEIPEEKWINEQWIEGVLARCEYVELPNDQYNDDMLSIWREDRKARAQYAKDLLEICREELARVLEDVLTVRWSTKAEAGKMPLLLVD